MAPERFTAARRRRFVSLLMGWHDESRRGFLWRRPRKASEPDGDRDPYRVLVAEFMLQQTGTAHVERRLADFLRQFPTAASLARATRAEVLRAWQGLGYNRRALWLHAAAQEITERRRFPRTHEELITLTGIGAYTASAIQAFAFNAEIAVVDVNVERVLSRVTERMRTRAEVLPTERIRAIDLECLPRGRSRDWHEALMDLGAQICTKQRPACAGCPVASACASAHAFDGVPAASEPKRSQERLYFGAPRRIWRGRVLGCIASSTNGITLGAITKRLSAAYDVNAKELAGFLSEVTGLLEREGFIRTERGALHLR